MSDQKSYGRQSRVECGFPLPLTPPKGRVDQPIRTDRYPGFHDGRLPAFRFHRARFRIIRDR